MLEKFISNLRSRTEKVSSSPAVKTQGKDVVELRPISPRLEKEYLRGKNPDLTF